MMIGLTILLIGNSPLPNPSAVFPISWPVKPHAMAGRPRNPRNAGQLGRIQRGLPRPILADLPPPQESRLVSNDMRLQAGRVVCPQFGIHTHEAGDLSQN